MKLPPFQSLLDAHREDVYRFLVASVGVNDVDDCFQDTFAAALVAYPDLREAANLKGWLFTIAHHKAMDFYRRRKRSPIPVEVIPDLPGAMPPNPSDDDVWNRVRALSSKQRSAIALRYLEDLSYRTIGDVIGCSEAAARQNVRAGLARLREDYSK